ncbi:hypothetical protein KP509_31G047800 [Ceratopteris richardii]|uniref:Uncharacterized protein n=1 Tax=Ceratopteris richardii TaxID=49495 RepID=A0A8T2QZW7_CERRI|nr:hypothetical protein KP509_31G047800 [Ceratopteris richardii]
MSELASPCEIILGRPWFKMAKVKQDWGSNVVMITKGKRNVTIPMHARCNISLKEKPLVAQTISLAEEVEDDEEEKFLKANPIVVPVFEVDVESILQHERIFEEQAEIHNKERGVQEKRDAKDRVEKIYEKRYTMSNMVKEEDLKELNLGREAGPKMMHSQ